MEDGEEMNIVNHDDTAWRPQQLIGTFKNPDGIRQVTGLAVASTGAVDDGNFGLHVAAQDDGEVLVVTEDLCPWIENPDALCSVHEKSDDIADDECVQRHPQMKQAHRDTFGDDQDTRREIHIHLPFRVEPASLKWECVGHPKNGHRVCHVDVLEKSKLNQQQAKMLNGNNESVVVSKKQHHSQC